MDPYTPPPGSYGIDEILQRARSHLSRLTPAEALAHLTNTSRSDPPVILVDIRPAAQRAAEGEIGGAIVIERNVLEWRLDPRSDAKLDIAGRYDLRVIVFCQEGYTSSLAARDLQELGLLDATDIAGGYRAWKEDGLPEKI
jgi:rhodanese-related sulfurtransferase